MADIQNFAALIRGRWDWQRYGYESAFPRGCQFTDLDAAVEFDGRRLVIETKHHDGIGPCDYPSGGQLAFLRDEVKLGKVVIVLYGCGVCDSPQAARVLGETKLQDQWKDWRGLPIEERRVHLRNEINAALGLAGAA